VVKTDNRRWTGRRRLNRSRRISRLRRSGGLQTCKKLKATARVTVRDATGNATVKTYKLTIKR
jgi:hypothetical protein